MLPATVPTAEDQRLVQLDVARQSLATARSLPDVKQIRDMAAALQQYVKQQQYSLEVQNDAAELKLRAERKAGDMLREMALAKAAPGNQHTGTLDQFHDGTRPTTLADVAITKTQSHRWQQEAALPEAAFESYVATTRSRGQELTSAALYELARRTTKRADILARLHEARLMYGKDALPAPYQIIVADPPWEYDFPPSESRAIENQYPTATVETICSHVPDAAEDSVLFLWVPAPKNPEGLQVMAAWGFTYKAGAVWDKEVFGMGHWFRGQHELILVGTKGEMSPPAESLRIRSVIREPRGAHSEKPEALMLHIENAYPGCSKLEMYSRAPREGWAAWGNEVGEAAD
jgi:N6-adenosine-specific RNA methylase IME4